MNKITIIETNCHGCGIITCNGHTETYCYDDGELGDVASTLQALIRMGAIPSNMVDIYTIEEAVEALNEKG